MPGPESSFEGRFTANTWEHMGVLEPLGNNYSIESRTWGGTESPKAWMTTVRQPVGDMPSVNKDTGSLLNQPRGNNIWKRVTIQGNPFYGPGFCHSQTQSNPQYLAAFVSRETPFSGKGIVPTLLKPWGDYLGDLYRNAGIPTPFPLGTLRNPYLI